MASVRALFTVRAEKRLDQIEGQGEDDDLGALVRDVGEGLQVAQLQGARLERQRLCRHDQLLGRLGLALGVDDLGAPGALGLGLLRHGANHAFIEIHVLDLDVRDLDAPVLGGLIEDALQVDVQLVALREQVVHLVLTHHRAQRRLRHLAGGIEGVRDLDNGLAGINDAEIHDRVHLDRHVVARDHILFGHVEYDDPQVHPAGSLYAGPDEYQPGTLDAREAPQREYHDAFVFVQHVDGAEHQHDDEYGDGDHERHECLQSRAALTAARPTMLDLPP